MGKLLKAILLTLIHFIAFILIALALLPIATWYFNHRPILGVDFYNTASFIKYFKENLHLFQQNYFDSWYGGLPLNSYFINNWFKVYSIVARLLPLFSAIKVTSLTAFYLMLIFVYLGTYKLSKNPFIAVVLSILVLYSSNLYGSLTWGGSLPYFANQFFLPLILWILATFLESGNKRWYYLAILALGFAIVGHIGNAIAFALPSGLILVLLGKRFKPTSVKERIKDSVVFIILLVLLVYSYIGKFFYFSLDLLLKLFQGFHLIKLPSILNSNSDSSSSQLIAIDINQQIAEFYRNIFYKTFTDTNQLLLIGLGGAALIFLFSVIFSKRKRDTLAIVSWILICVYSVVHVYLNANGVNFLPQGWYRAFWQFPVTAAFLIAAFIGVSQSIFASYGKVVNILVFFIWSVIAVITGFMSYSNHDSDKTIAVIETGSSPSSAYPEALNLFKTEDEFNRLTKQLLPPWMESTNKDYRFFNDDAQVNVWWNAVFDIPLVRGYLDPPGNAGQHHLLDQAVAGGGLIENYKYSEEIARNMALYYIDWYAIKYFEGGHDSQSPNKKPSSYIENIIAEQTDIETKGVYFLHQTKSGKPEVHEEVVQYLKYYRIADDATSPVYSVSLAPTIACFCDLAAYESLLKILSMHNINSRNLISLYIPENVDKYSKDDFTHFDAVLLSNYKYKNRDKLFDLLENYLQQGGKVIFDTGGEVEESRSTNLPEWFPFDQTNRSGLGTQWILDINAENEIFKDVDTASFAPPKYENKEWNFSYPENSLKTGVDVLLKHDGKPLLTRSKIGNGALFWSGMNLIYHVQYHTNFAESELFMNIVKSVVPVTTHEYHTVNTTHNGSSLMNIQSSAGGKGILIKLQLYDNWWATVNGKKASIFKAGPSSPGFMYIPISSVGTVEARIKYIGNYTVYFKQFLTWVVGLILLDLSIFNGLVLSKYLHKIYHFSLKRTGTWWEKEEE